MQDSTAKDALARSIAARLLPLSHDELRVIDWVLIGLENGVEPYGRMDVSRDRRDFRIEAAQEFRDAFVYLAGDFIARVARQQERIESGAFEDEEPTATHARNSTSSECDDCGARPGCMHRSGCQWTTIVPASGAV